MRFGCFRGMRWLMRARCYMRELDGVLLPRIMAQLRQRLIESSTRRSTLRVPQGLRLMLGQPEHLDKAQLIAIVDLEFARAYPSDPDARQGLSKHLRALLDGAGTLPPCHRSDVVEQARNANPAGLRGAFDVFTSEAELLRRHGPRAAPRCGAVSGRPGIPAQKRRKLADPVPGLYTRAYSRKWSRPEPRSWSDKFIADSWVLGAIAAGTLRQSAQ